MIRFLPSIVVLSLLCASVVSANQAVAGEIGRVFRTTGAKIEAPAPPPAPPSVQAPGLPQGWRELSVSAYSYCLTGRTASGRYTAPGVVAVDPRVIPMGSKLYIPGYGWGVAADTGGAIKGNKIDVWLPTAGQCYSWGVRRVTIKVFPPSR